MLPYMIHIINSIEYRAYHISLTYVQTGASIKPSPNPANRKAIVIDETELEYANNSHDITNGIFTSIMTFRRPILSQIKPDKKHPNGCPMNFTLARTQKKKKFSPLN